MALHPGYLGDASQWTIVDFAQVIKTSPLFAVPLFVGGSGIRVIETIQKDKTDYTEEDVTILEKLALPLEVAIHNTNLPRRLEASLLPTAGIDNPDRIYGT